jgi:hypothetical protein
MRIAYRLIFVFLLAAIVWLAYASVAPKRSPVSSAAPVTLPAPAQPGAVGAFDLASSSSDTRFSCDGRTMCTQMRSCEEAKYFLKNCPGTKMDGNHDGIPCQIQWCR